MGIWNFARGLRRRQARFFVLLERQSALVHEAAESLSALGSGSAAAQVRERLHDHEHESEALVREIEGSLAKAYLTPIDREDIYALAQQLDDIVELIHRVGSRCEQLQIAAQPPAMTAMIRVLNETTTVVARAVPMLRARDYAGILAAKAQVGELEREGDRAYADAIRGIFMPGADQVATLLRDREVLDGLDRTLEQCVVVVHTLSMLAVKHR